MGKGIFLILVIIILVILTGTVIFLMDRGVLKDKISNISNKTGSETEVANLTSDNNSYFDANEDKYDYNNPADNKIDIVSEKPSEINISSSPCGFYYGAYGLCGGYCSSGSCTSEGRSCYCKQV
ncbi:MAG: hypothetical protein NT076_02970 [Candidatus Pacearchaeota archaeon]|nr:hypothetical protein [Candidatus Pacearchaeota archaeon]